MTDLRFIVQFVWENFLHIWPYLLLTIPLAVAVNLSGVSKKINRAFQAGPLLAILLATAVGAFSPFCSCTVVPLVASLLISGVPLAPVMAFWIASPSMDPEIFFLSAGILGWELALWRLAGTLLLSLGAGLLTHFIMQRGWLGESILRRKQAGSLPGVRQLAGASWQRLRHIPEVLFNREQSPAALPASISLAAIPLTTSSPSSAEGFTCAANCCSEDSGGSCAPVSEPFQKRLLRETWAATRMVVQFMALAFFLEAIILLFVPEAWIAGLLGEQNRWAVPLAALLGVPVYTSNLTALPLIGGLLGQGMDPAAALSFLIAGPTTTLPAMAAVFGLVQRRVFALYVSFALIGGMVLGMIFQLFHG